MSIIFEVKRYILEAGGETPEQLLSDLVGRGYRLSTISGDVELGKANLLAER